MLNIGKRRCLDDTLYEVWYVRGGPRVKKFGCPRVRGKIVLCEATHILGAGHREEKMV